MGPKSTETSLDTQSQHVLLISTLPFSLHLSFPIVAFLLVGHPRSASSCPPLYPPHPSAANCWESFFVHGLQFTEEVSVFAQGSSIFQHLGDVPFFFLIREPLHLKLFQNQTLPKAFCTPSWQGPSPLRVFEFVWIFFHNLSCPASPACIDSSFVVPIFATQNPNTFCTKVRRRALPKVMGAIFPACVWNLLATTLVLNLSLVSSYCSCFPPDLNHRFLCAVAHHSVHCFLASSSLFTKVHISVCMGLSSSQSFHSSTKQLKIAAYCNAAYTSSLSSWTVLDLTCATSPPSIIAPPSVSSSAFSLPFAMNLSKSVMCSISFLLRCALTCSTSSRIPSGWNLCNSSQIKIHKSAFFALKPMHLISLLHRPSMIPLLSTCTIVRPTAFVKRHKKAVSSALVILRCTSSSASSVPYTHASAPSPRRDPTAHQLLVAPIFMWRPWCRQQNNLNFRSGSFLVTSLSASCNTIRRSKQLRLDPREWPWRSEAAPFSLLPRNLRIEFF